MKEVRPKVLLLGISLSDFYNMTFGEVADLLNEHIKSAAQKEYDAAATISAFIICRLNGDALPTIHDLYPTLFKAPEEDYETNELLFRQFATQHNAQRGRK